MERHLGLLKRRIELIKRIMQIKQIKQIMQIISIKQIKQIKATKVVNIILAAVAMIFILYGCEEQKASTTNAIVSANATASANASTSQTTETFTSLKNSAILPGTTPMPEINIEGKPVPILYYHAVADETFGLEELFVRIDEFERQMKYMKDNGYEAIAFDDFKNSIANIEKPFIITFDDGYQNIYTNAYPILKKYNFKAVVFLVNDFIDGGSMLTKENILMMRDIISFESHTLNHTLLTDLTTEEVERQLKTSKEEIENLTGKEVNVLAYPVGMHNDRIINQATSYYKMAVLAGGGLYKYNPSNNMQMVRIYIPRGLDISTFDSKIKGLVK